ncbi:MAG: SCPU domain-containing protein [Nitrospiraceae bacterium]|nr:MAG: SCPU domain-containing protein [Nitrospiraceae bacterium]
MAAIIFSNPLYPAHAVCTLSTTPVNFGSYNVLSSSPLDTAASITVDCDETPPPFVTLSIGPSPNSGGFSPRKMKQSGSTDLISYNLYIDAACTQIWGDGSGNTFTAQNKVFKRSPWISTVYGRIPPQQNVSAGTYTETLTVTIVW